jgi:hypothetical protein
MFTLLLQVLVHTQTNLDETFVRKQNSENFISLFQTTIEEKTVAFVEKVFFVDLLRIINFRAH